MKYYYKPKLRSDRMEAMKNSLKFIMISKDKVSLFIKTMTISLFIFITHE